MQLTKDQVRFLAPIALTSLLLLALGIFAAVYLHEEQKVSAASLRENIDSRRAADDLEVTLLNLIALRRESKRAEGAEALHKQIDEGLRQVVRLADKAEEARLA